jgi:hypothetical protein
MPTLFFTDFSGHIDQAQAEEHEEHYSVVEGPRAGVYPKLKKNKYGTKGFFLSWGAAREAALDLLDAGIARNERDLEILKAKRRELDEASAPDQ